MALEPNQGLSFTMRRHCQHVRMFMRDFAELNLLVRGEESSDRFIAWATLDFVSDFNGSTTPFTNVSLEEMYMRGWMSFAVRGTTVTLLQSLMIIYARNHLPFSDGGISVSLNDKAPLIMQMLSLLLSAYEQNKRSMKTALNIQALLEPDSTGLFSDYSMLAGSYGY
jgi:hypothetical protein